KGAINLVMHLSGVDYKNAVRILIDTFEKDEVARETVAYADRIAEKRVEAIAKEPAVVPGPDNGRWPRAKAYLEEVRKIPCKASPVAERRRVRYGQIPSETASFPGLKEVHSLEEQAISRLLERLEIRAADRS
ncbi:hypothetical protein B1A_08195, partial [mine drainage metagenome]